MGGSMSLPSPARSLCSKPAATNLRKSITQISESAFSRRPPQLERTCISVLRRSSTHFERGYQDLAASSSFCPGYEFSIHFSGRLRTILITFLKNLRGVSLFDTSPAAKIPQKVRKPAERGSPGRSSAVNTFFKRSLGTTIKLSISLPP